MTNQEAIADLETLLAYIPIYRRFYQSISMGIKALQSIEDIKAEIQPKGTFDKIWEDAEENGGEI